MGKTRNYRDISKQEFEQIAHVTWCWSDKDKCFVVTAHPIDRDGHRIEGPFRTRKRAHSEEELETVIFQTAETMFGKLRNKSYKKKTVTSEIIDNESPMVKAFEEVIKKGHLSEYWAHSTAEKYLGTFRKHVLPVISSVKTPDDFTVDDRDELWAKLKSKSYNDSRSHRNLKNIEEGTNRKFESFQVIYDEMKVTDPSLPDIKLSESRGRISRMYKEQLKALPISVHTAIRAECEIMLPIKPRLARAVMIMESSGPRTAETAAVISQDMVEFGNNIAIDIGFQEDKGERTHFLKTSYSYRRVVCDIQASDFIRRANKLIGDEESSRAPVTSKELNDAIKKILLKVCSNAQDYLDDAKRSYYMNPEYDREGNPISAESAYCLRRSRQNILANICGLSRCEQDYLLGHKPINKHKIKFDSKNTEIMQAIADKLELCRFTQGPIPCLKVVNIEENDTEIDIRNTKIMLRNGSNSVMKVKVSTKSEEPGDIIDVYSDGRIETYKAIPSNDKDGIRRKTEII